MDLVYSFLKITPFRFRILLCWLKSSSVGQVSCEFFCSAAVLVNILSQIYLQLEKILIFLSDVIFRDTSALVLPPPKQRGNIQGRANTGTVKYGLGWLFWSKYSWGKAVVKQTRLPPPVPPPVPPTQKLVPVSPIQKPVTEPPF